MKKLSKVILFFVVLIPIFIYAKNYDNYNNSINFANSYMNKFPDKNKFLFKSGPYTFENANVSEHPLLKRVGFLNKDEYLLTKSGKSSYLSSGQEYWTMTESISNNHFYIDYDILSKSNNAYSGTRVTQYVLPTTVVKGNGTFNSPWVFENRYSVVFKVNSSKYGSVNRSNEMVIPNSIIDDIRITANTGYRYSSDDCGLNYIRKIDETTKVYKTNPIEEDTICVINFERRKIRITYDCAGGSGTIPSSTVAYGKDYKIEDYTCERTGYTQETWRTAGDYEWDKGTYTEFKVENGERGLYDDWLDLKAKWKANNYTVSFNCNGGSGSVDSQPATYASPFTLTSDTCSKTGYTQDGWNEKADGTGTAWTTSNKNNWTWDRTSNVTLYAKWKPNTYTVSFDCNGGSGAPANQSATYNSNFTLTSGTCSRSGYNQKGWNEKSDGSGTSWTTSNTTNWKWTRTSNVKLYAVWEMKEVTTAKVWTSQGKVDWYGTKFPFSVKFSGTFKRKSDGNVYVTYTVSGDCDAPGPTNYVVGDFYIGSYHKSINGETYNTNKTWFSATEQNIGSYDFGDTISIEWSPTNNGLNSWDSSVNDSVTLK